MKLIATLCAAILAGPLCTAASAQPYTINWYTVDGGGGGASSAGAFSLTGTAGQPDAGTATAGAITVYGGFWNGAGEDCPADFNRSGTVTV